MIKRVLVTGGAAGIGRAVSERLIHSHYSVTVQHRSSAIPSGANAVCGDFSTLQGIDAFVHDYRRAISDTTHLVHCVGSYYEATLASTTDAQWEDLLCTNLHAARKLALGLQPSVKSIVFMGMAGLASLRAGGRAPAYMLAKEALWTLTVGLAKELGSSGVRVNMVSPYWTERSVSYPEDIKKAIPLGRLAHLEEIAATVQHLLEHQYITGQNVEVAGGAGL